METTAQTYFGDCVTDNQPSGTSIKIKWYGTVHAFVLGEHLQKLNMSGAVMSYEMSQNLSASELTFTVSRNYQDKIQEILNDIYELIGGKP